MTRFAPIRAILVWVALLSAVFIPLVAASFSPLMAWRDPVYILAGFAGIAALGLMLVQPLLAGGYLPGLPARLGRRVHRVVGGLLVAAVVLHVLALWITSPPDVVDVLLFRSPGPFSVWGALAMWAIFAAAGLALLKRRLHIRVWRLAHTLVVIIAVVGTVLHAMLIEGTMESATKTLLCAVVVLALLKAVYDLRVWASRRRR